MRCAKCGSETPIGHRCIMDDLEAIRNVDLSDHPLFKREAEAAPEPREDVAVAEVETGALPRKGEVWKWGWLWAEILTAGPKRITYRHDTRVGWEVSSCPTDRFLARFHKTGLSADRRAER